MTSVNFAYWLQGYFELEKERTGQLGELGADQVQCIAKHLALVFAHEIDPSAGNKAEQDKLNKIHNLTPSPYKPPVPNGQKLRC